MLDISLTGVLWTVINLLVLYLLLKKFLFQPVTNLMDRRARDIEDNMANAQRERAEADLLKARYETKLAHAGQDAAALVQDAHNRGEREREAILASAKAEAKKLDEATRAHLEAEREQMLRGARQEVAALALLAAAKVSGQTLDEDGDKAIIDAFLSEAGDLP